MTNTTYTKRHLTHVPVSYLAKACPSIIKILKRTGTPVKLCGDLRELGFTFDADVPYDAPMLSIFDVKRLGAHWLPLSSAVDMDFSPDGYWMFRASCQVPYMAYHLQRQVEKTNWYLNFIDTLVDPITNSIVKLRNYDLNEQTTMEDVYHEDIFVEVPAISEGVCYFFIENSFFQGEMTFDHYHNGHCKRHAINNMFGMMEDLTAHTGMPCKLIRITNWRGLGDVLDIESATEELDKMEAKIQAKADKAKKRAQKKYAKEQEDFFNNIPF